MKGKNMKRIISILITISLLASLVLLPSHAFALTEEDCAVVLMRELEIMQGDENGDMMLDKKVSRAEFAKIAIAASPNKDSVAVGLKQSPFRDVPYTQWYAPYVKAAVTAGYVVGYLDATYRPENTVKYEEAVTVMLRVLGYDDSTFTDAFPYGQISKAQGLDLLDNVNASIGDELDRRQVMMLAYNAIKASIPASPTQDPVFNMSKTENVDVIATGNEDDSLGADKVYTSAGTFDKGAFFIDSLAGMTGTIYLRNGNELVAFLPDEGKPMNGYKSYFVYSVLPDASIVGYRNGGFEEMDIPDGAAVYNNQSRTTYAAVKGALSTGDTLNVKYTDNGSVDYIVYDTNNLTGPVKVTSDNWTAQVGASGTSKVFRGGVESTVSAVSTNDIVYYSEPLDVVFAYTDKVTGVYEKASPTKDSPESVTISGNTYDIEGIDAFNELSSNGSFRYGDTVTILLGRTGGVAGVMGTGTASVSTTSGTSSGSTAGYVIAAGKKDYTNPDNTVYSSYYATIVTPDGSTREYETQSDCTKLVCSAVRITFKNGKAMLSRSTKGAVSGKVNATKRTVGTDYLADDVKILDIANAEYDDIPAYCVTYPQRLNGVTIDPSNVLYSSKNSAGEIDELILSEVTGDMYTYGYVLSSVKSTGTVTVPTGKKETVTSPGIVYDKDDTEHKNPQVGVVETERDVTKEEERLVSNTLTIEVGDSTYSYGANISATKGPCKIKVSGTYVDYFRSLTSYSGQITNLTRTTATIGGNDYLLSDRVVVYYQRDLNTYLKIPIDDAISGNYSMTAYYDKQQSSGGRIRIIVAKDK